MWGGGKFPLGNPPHSHLQPLPLLLADETVLVGALCLRGCKRNTSRFNSSLYCCSAPMFTHFMDPGCHCKAAHQKVHFVVPGTSQTWKESLLMGINMYYFSVLHKFPE